MCFAGMIVLSCTNGPRKGQNPPLRDFSVQSVSEMLVDLEVIKETGTATVLAGWVRDASSGEELPGVDVVLMDADKGAVKLKKATSLEGYFRIVSDKIDVRDKLSLQYIGYDSRIYTISELVDLFTEKSR